MTGIYIRWRRNGRIAELELDELTDTELAEWSEQQRERGKDGWRWAVVLAAWIRDNVRAEKAQQ